MDWRAILFSDKYDIDDLDNRDEAAIVRIKPLGDALARYHRARVRGLEHVPEGAALYVGNHSAGASTPDTFIFMRAVYDAHGIAAVPYGLGHEWAIRLRGIHELLVPLGAVRASHANAERLLERGHKVLVYPGGDEDSTRPFWRRDEIVFGGRRGYIRLALRAGVPIVPVVTCGAQSTWLVLTDGKLLARALRLDKLFRVKTWPITVSVPWGLWVGMSPPFLPLPARIFIEVLPPIAFERTGPDAANDEAWVATCAERVESQMQRCLDRLAAERKRAGPFARGQSSA